MSFLIHIRNDHRAGYTEKIELVIRISGENKIETPQIGVIGGGFFVKLFCRSLSSPQYADLFGTTDGFNTRVDVELTVDRLDVGASSADRDDQLIGDLCAGETGCQ